MLLRVVLPLFLALVLVGLFVLRKRPNRKPVTCQDCGRQTLVPEYHKRHCHATRPWPVESVTTDTTEQRIKTEHLPILTGDEMTALQRRYFEDMVAEKLRAEAEAKGKK